MPVADLMSLFNWVEEQINEDEACLRHETDDDVRAEYNGAIEALTEVKEKIEEGL